MPLNVDALGTGSLVVNNLEVNVSGINTSYQKFNKDWSFINVDSTEVVIDSILVPAEFSCGSLTPYVSFAGNLSIDRYENLTFKIYLNEKPILDGNETLISRPINNVANKPLEPNVKEDNEGFLPDINGSFTFRFGASFLENVLYNISYEFKNQNKTKIDYLGTNRMLGSNYEFGSIETFDCSKQYYAILTATKTGDSIGVASLVATLNKDGGFARPA